MREIRDPSPSEAQDTFAAVAEGLGIADKPRKLGRFVVERRLGDGAMGVVYLARDVDLDRPVAVKLLRSSRRDLQTRDRFAREARVLGRLRHPNVVAAFERGTAQGHDFVAMEYVEGGNLRQWLNAEPRTPDEVVDKFVQAARGLAAAHDAGILHRDFKPDNVLVGADGRAQVADFGLAGGPRSDSTDPSIAEPDEELTLSGVVVGTPAYMAPEVRGGAAASESSDQYSFCVSLFEALLGDRPPRRDDERVPSSTGDVVVPRGTGRIPARVRVALRRGLRADPAERWPSLRALAGQLERSRGSARERWFLAGGLLAASVAVVALARTSDEPCDRAGRSIDAVWNEARMRAVQTALVHGQATPSTEVVDRVLSRLDDYAASLVSQAQQACQAHELRAEQTAETHDLRLRCIGRRQVELDEYLKVLEEGGPNTSLTAPSSVSQLIPASVCADTEALHDVRPPPEDPWLRARVAGVQRMIARIVSLRSAGRMKEVPALLDGVRDLAEEIDDPTLTADVSMVSASLHATTGNPNEALASFRRVFALANEIGDTRLAAAAAVYAMEVAANQLHDRAQAEEWKWLASPLVNRYADDPGLVGQYWMSSGALAYLRDDHEGAISAWRQAIEMWSKPGDEQDPRLRSPMQNIASSLRTLGRLDEALELQHRVDDIIVSAYGKTSIVRASVLNSLGVTYTALARLDPAQEHLELSLQLYDARSKTSVGAGHPLNNLGIIAARRGDHEAALELFGRAMARWQPAYGDTHPYIGDALGNRGLSELALGRAEAAKTSLKRALKIFADRDRTPPAEFVSGLERVDAQTAPPMPKPPPEHRQEQDAAAPAP